MPMYVVLLTDPDSTPDQVEVLGLFRSWERAERVCDHANKIIRSDPDDEGFRYAYINPIRQAELKSQVDRVVRNWAGLS